MMLNTLATYNSKIIKIIIISITCFIFYGNTFQNDYVLDDAIMITHNQFTLKGIEGIPDIFKYDSWAGAVPNIKMVWGGRYRPLSLVTFAIERQFFGENPHISHFFNILLLILTAIVLYFVLLKMFNNHISNSVGFFDFPFITALLFIAHPVHVEAVSNIKGRDEMLALVGCLAALLYVLKYIDTGKFSHLLLSFLFFSVGLFSKENSLTFLVIIPISVYYYNKNEEISRSLKSLLPVILASILFLVARSAALGETSPPQGIINNPFLNATISEKYATIMYTFGVYIKLLFFPHPLTFDYYPFHIKIVNWGNAFVIISFLFYLLSLLYAVLNFKKKSVISFGILFYLITISVASNVLFPIGTFMSERFIYMPSVGFLIVIAWIISTKLPVIIKSYNYRVSLIMMILVLFFIKTYSRNKAWKDSYTLFTTDIKTSYNSIKGNIALGNYLLDNAYKTQDSMVTKRFLTEAVYYSKRAYDIYPDYINSAIQLGYAYTVNGKLDSAIIYYKKAIDLRPNDVDKIFSSFIEPLLNSSNDVDFKIRNYLELSDLSPGNFSINYNLGYLYGRYKNNQKESAYYLEKALAINPGDSSTLQNLLLTYSLTGNKKKGQEIVKIIKELKRKKND